MSAIRLARGFTGRAAHREVRRLLPRPRRRAARLGRLRASRRSACPTPPASRGARRRHDRPALQRRRRRRGGRSPSAATEIACVITEAAAGNMGVVPPARRLHRGAAPDHRRARRAAHQRRGDDRLPVLALGLVRPRGPDAAAPDLFTFGKVMGGGFPAAAFGGRADVMALLAPVGPVYQAGTLSGNPVATAAGLATLPAVHRRGLRPPRRGLARDRATRVASALCPPPACRTAIQWAGSMFCVFFRDGRRCATTTTPATRTSPRFRRVLPLDARPGRLPAAERVRGVVRLGRARRRGRRPRARGAAGRRPGRRDPTDLRTADPALRATPFEVIAAATGQPRSPRTGVPATRHTAAGIVGSTDEEDAGR